MCVKLVLCCNSRESRQKIEGGQDVFCKFRSGVKNIEKGSQENKNILDAVVKKPRQGYQKKL